MLSFSFNFLFLPLYSPPFFQALSDSLSAALIFLSLLLVLSSSVSVFFSVALAAVCLRTSGPFFPTRGNKPAPRSYLNLACPKVSHKASNRQGLYRRAPTVEQYFRLLSIFLLVFLSLLPHFHHCRDVGCALSESWHPSSWEINTRMETNFASFTVVTVIKRFFACFFFFSQYDCLFSHCLKQRLYTFISLLPLFCILVR